MNTERRGRPAARGHALAKCAERRELRAQLTDPAPVMDAAAAFIAVRARSVAEVRRRLRHLGYPHALADRIVDRLVEIGYLDDRQFARAWVESRDRARPRGESALRRELAQKGVAREIVDEALAERTRRAAGAAPPDVTAAAALLGRRRAALERELDPRRRRQKAYALLARNGFDPETCREATSAFFADRESASYD